MPFNGPGPGRPKGSRNRVTDEVRDLARAIVDDPNYRTSLKVRVTLGEAPHMETLLWHYAYGKPKETVVIETSDPVDSMSVDEVREQAMALARELSIVAPESDGIEATH